MKKIAYSFTVLRYVHDIVTGEFVNIGIVLYVPSTREVMFRVRRTIGRLKGVFPDIDRAAFLTSVNAVHRALSIVAKRETASAMFSEAIDAGGFARAVVPPDDSSLQWSTVATGVAEQPAKSLNRLYERYVSKYDHHSRHRRTDDDVWRPVKQRLEEMHLADRFQEKAIIGSVDEISFKHAWKNGLWHVYEPLSFDLVDADGIKGKAREWLGHLSAVLADSEAEVFKAHFVVGRPSNPALETAYKNAIAILKAAPNRPEVFEETDVDQLVANIEDEVKSHEAGRLN
ncbi:MAG: DUF3037 domain-containing protein [Asticcacaulis sp.]|uniref:DUF3037 domain-containing protein n=1 Tax=Asticcacaulis sp. TaxID=1872648 RepID=UPI003F7C6AD9